MRCDHREHMVKNLAYMVQVGCDPPFRVEASRRHQQGPADVMVFSGDPFVDEVNWQDHSSHRMADVRYFYFAENLSFIQIAKNSE